MDKKEQTRLRVQRYRDKRKSVTSDDNVTQSPDSVTESADSVTQSPETVPASYVEGIDGRKYEVLPERSRYLELSDGQRLDRLNQPTPNIDGAMQACNESSYNFKPNQSSKERVKAMVKEATG